MHGVQASVAAPPTAANAPPTMVTQPPPPRPDPNAKGPGGTLTSPIVGQQPKEHPVEVAIVSSQGTLPSENLPMFSAKRGGGVPAWLVVLLVIVALVIGLAAGLVFPHLR